MSTATKPGKTFRCARTGKEVTSPQRPRGWKEIGGSMYSPDGWKQLFAVKGLKLAIGWPREKEEQERLKVAMRRGMKQSRDLFNWMMHEMYARDRPRLDENGKLTKFDVPCLYGEATKVFPLEEFHSDLISAAENRVRKIYQANRWDFAAGRQGKQISFRRHPYCVRARTATVYLDEEGRPRVKVPICRERFDLAIVKSARNNRPGHDNSVQWNTLVKALQGGLPYGELMFVTDQRGNIFVIVVMTLPIRDQSTKSGTFYVKSTKEELILALNAKDEKLWAYNADQLIGWKHAHRRGLQRLGEDTKAEDRPRPSFEAKRTAMVQKFRNRVDTTVKQVAARIVNYAVRRRFETLELDLTVKDFFPRFDFAKLETLVKQKCTFEGVQFVSVTNTKPEEVTADNGLKGTE